MGRRTVNREGARPQEPCVAEAATAGRMERKLARETVLEGPASVA